MRITGLAVGAGLLFAAAAPAGAATLCVNSAGSNGCYATIGAAVTAAGSGDTVMVHPGLYNEAVKITRSLSLVGADPANTVIDAVGRSNGVYVDGIDVPHLARVSIANFTIKNAKFEGILVANATDVTIVNNRVLDNDRALVISNGEGVCSGLPAFETNEGDDCGEGLHLLGANHVTVLGNLVHGNAGGILLTDETAAARDNLIQGNTVSDNAYDCGITLASHQPASMTGATAPFGVSFNTVVGNVSKANGTQPPGGAGVGIFTSIPTAAAAGNVVIGNTLKGNGQAGVALHSHSPNQKLTNNAIIGNTISDNGPDSGDAATSGPVGINLYAVSPATGTTISGNVISGESIDVQINTPTPVGVHLNELLGKDAGLDNAGAGLVDATLNYWGCPDGPPAARCSAANGARILTVPALPQR